MTAEPPGPSPVRWGLWVRGRLRTTVVLGDAEGAHVADLSLHGWPRKRRRLKASANDVDWTVRVQPGRLTVDRGDERRLTVDGDEVEVLGVGGASGAGDARGTGRRLTWPAHEGGVHRGTLRDPEDGREVLTVTAAAGGNDEPVAVIDVAADLPDPLAVAFAACAVELITRPRGSAMDGVDPGAGFDIAIP
jgi:hypothetical protein